MLVHAAALSSEGITPNTHVVVLCSKSIKDLERLKLILRNEDIPHAAFHEPDPPWNGQLMSVGIHPVSDRRLVRRYLKRFKLLGEKS